MNQKRSEMTKMLNIAIYIKRNNDLLLCLKLLKESVKIGKQMQVLIPWLSGHPA